MNKEVTLEKISKKISHIKEELDEVDKLENKKYKVILLLSLLDSYSQINVFYTGKSSTNENAKRFKEFVTVFYPMKFWEDIGFVNLSYEFPDNEFNEFQNVIRKMLGSSINNLENFHDNQEVTKLLLAMQMKLMEIKEDKKNVVDIINKYKYKNLIYKYRCKLFHEYSFPGVFDDMVESNLPCYISKIGDKTGVMKDAYDLVFPYEFIKELTFNSIKNYLGRCLSEYKYPYYNYKEKFTWYEWENLLFYSRNFSGINYNK